MTLASVSVAPRRGDRTSHMRSGHRSSGFSNDEGGRRSMDSNVFGPAMDRQAWERAQQRRKILEELVGTEEGYVADLKALIDNISDILRLHEELLDELHRVIPYSEFSPDEGKQTFLITARKHMRWHSADVIPGRVSAIRGAARDHRRSLDLRGPVGENPVGATADSCTAAAVAQVFDRLLSRFFVYQEYSAKYEIMLQDQETTQRALPTWQTYERGIEALSKSLSSVNNREASRKKALAFADLLAKPLQRVCKYPLLFKDLCKQTPVYDDPESFAELEKVRYRLEETNREINEAKDDPEKRSLIAASWLLQDRMVLEHETSRAFTFHLLGHVLLCGALHVAYQAKDGVKGHYMVCALYKSCLILATVDKAPPSTYEVVAVVCLVTASIEEADNGKGAYSDTPWSIGTHLLQSGLQCHTTPHTWKLVFENENRMFELILTACSAKEEEQWRKHLNQRITKEVQDYSEGHYSTQDTLSSLKLGLRSIGTAFGKPQGFVRRMSFHRAATLGPKTLANQVIIKNTQAVNDVKDNSSTTHLPIGRSQSVQTPSHVPTLAPRRIDRVRLETALKDVWTRDILPFPGMGYRRPDNPLRASANTVMRKLSMASIASNFSKRSVSYTGLSHTRTENTGVPAQRPCPAALRKPQPVADKRRKHAVVDFHNAPSAFLPADFELHSPGGKRSRLSSFASTNSERPRTPLTFPVFASRPPGTARIRASDVKGEACSNVVGKSLSDIDYARFDGAAGSLMTVTETRSSDGSEKESTIITKIPKKPRNRLFRFWG
ncbi:hypothetical protein LTR04_004923 [Oleoguttula sp. CCFEE 6159]|nr:hypothetical protein LTR04_004923 [Oleoguttula sp. CCFEE 6159]